MQFQNRFYSLLPNILFHGSRIIVLCSIFLAICSFAAQYERKVKKAHFKSPSGFIIADPIHRKKISIAQQRLDISIHNNRMHINKKPFFKRHIIISGKKGTFSYNGLQVHSAIQVSHDTNNKRLWVKALKRIKKPINSKKSSRFDTVNVLLDTVQCNRKDTIEIQSTGEHIALIQNATRFNKVIKKQSIGLQLKKDKLFIDGKRYNHAALTISTVHGHLRYKDNAYEGSFLLILNKKKLLIINQVPLEEYICSVLRTESWPGWPLEVNKVFAITSRTYVISMMIEAHKTKRPYHVHNTNIHQTYQGVHDKKLLKDAVKYTQGIILTYDKKPIIAMFDSCCGGIIPAHIEDMNFMDAPYLARPYACKHCKKCWIYTWKAEFTRDELHKRLFSYVGPVSNIRDLKVTKKDKAGLVKEVLVKARKKIRLEGKKLYNLLKEIKSFCYTIKRQKDKIILHGRGFGHHVGLCQWGAREMVRDGWDYKRILQFYYPGTQFMRYLLLDGNQYCR